MKTSAAAVLAVLALAAPASASVTATPMTPLAVTADTQLATLFQTDQAATLDLNSMNGWITDTSNGTACPTVSIRRGTSRRRCTLPAGGSVWYYGAPIGNPTYTTAFVGGLVAANITYTVTPIEQHVYTSWSGGCRPWMRNSCH